MQEKTCCIIGVRRIPESKATLVRSALHAELARAIEEGYERFLVGFTEGASLMAAALLAQLRRQYGHIHIVACIPCASRLARLQSGRHTRALLRECTELDICDETYSPMLALSHEQYLVGLSDAVIAVCGAHARGSTALGIAFARGKHMPLRMVLCEQDAPDREPGS